MLGVEERTGLDVFEMLALDVSLDEEKPCESPMHGRKAKHHEGPGEWYMQFQCLEVDCGYTTGVVLVCTKFKEVSLDNTGVTCVKCWTHQTAEESFIIVERK